LTPVYEVESVVYEGWFLVHVVYEAMSLACEAVGGKFHVHEVAGGGFQQHALNEFVSENPIYLEEERIPMPSTESGNSKEV
jgi:hypothetical protein